MPGRNRRVRLLALAAVTFFGLLVFTRERSRRREKDLDYFGKSLDPWGVGGGAVLRPSLADIPAHKERYPVPISEEERLAREQAERDWVVWIDPPEAPPATVDEALGGDEQQLNQGEQPVDEKLKQVKQPVDEELKQVKQPVDESKAQQPQVQQPPPPPPPQQQQQPRVQPDDTPVKVVQAPLDDPLKPDKASRPAAAKGNKQAIQLVGQGGLESSIALPSSSVAAHWSPRPEHFPIKTTIALPAGSSKPFAKIQRAEAKLAQNGEDKEKLDVIRAAAQHSWAGYRKYAFGHDELKPVSGEAKDSFNGWGATLVDSLDTLWIMGMIPEFNDAVSKVFQIDFTTSKRRDIPLFETTIRYLGGLIAAYDITGRDSRYRKLLDKAVELGEILYGAFDTPNRMPQTYYQWAPGSASQPHRAGSRVCMAELGTLSLEFTRLAQLTGEHKYYDAIARVTDAMDEFQNNTRLPGMWPTLLDASGCNLDALDEDEWSTSLPLDESPLIPGAVVGAPVAAGGDRLPDRDVSGSDDGAADSPPVPKPAQGAAPGTNAAGSKRTRYQDYKRELSLERDGISTPQRNVRREKKDALFGLEDECVPQGLVSVSPMSSEVYTLSGMSDSTYEYFPKQYMLLGGLVEQYKTMYLASAQAAIDWLLYKPMTPDERDILMAGEMKLTWDASASSDDDYPYKAIFKPEVAHLACFAGGMFAMGGVIFDLPEHVDIGAKLTDGCVWAYNVTNTGIMPEAATAMRCPDTWGECEWDEKAYWDALDPYAAGRMSAARRRPPPIATQPDAAPAVPAAVPSVPAVANAAHVAGADSAAEAPGLRRRQLDDADTPPREASELPAAGKTAETVAGSGMSGAQQITPTFDLDGDGVLNQEEFVAKKVFNERLPPGYVGIGGRAYILRPEAIESVFYLYRITGDLYWREVGWQMWESIANSTAADHGASAIDDVTARGVPLLTNSEESFWLAETLKYFYLLYSSPDLVSLDEWTFNTEAHPFKRPAFEFAR